MLCFFSSSNKNSWKRTYVCWSWARGGHIGNLNNVCSLALPFHSSWIELIIVQVVQREVV